MNAAKLSAFYETEFTKAKQDKIMISLHLKATMMKKSDPVMFGSAVKGLPSLLRLEAAF
jgi:monomeric isocitrate dehydrogenase